MAIETQPDRAEPAGSGPEVGGPGGVTRPWWLRPGAHLGVIGAAIGYLLGHLLGDFVGGGFSRSALSDTNDVAIVLGYAFAVIGWLAGLGVFNDPFRLTLDCLALRDGAFHTDVAGRENDELRPALFPGLALRLGEIWAA